MTTAEWLAAVRAARPELTPGQLAALRPACQRMAAHLAATETAPAATAGAARTAPQERNTDVRLSARG